MSNSNNSQGPPTGNTGKEIFAGNKKINNTRGRLAPGNPSSTRRRSASPDNRQPTPACNRTDTASNNAGFIRQSLLHGDLAPAFRPPPGWVQCRNCPHLIKSAVTDLCFTCRKKEKAALDDEEDDVASSLAASISAGPEQICSDCSAEPAIPTFEVCFGCLVKHADDQDDSMKCDRCGYEWDFYWDGRKFVYNEDAPFGDCNHMKAEELDCWSLPECNHDKYEK